MFYLNDFEIILLQADREQISHTTALPQQLRHASYFNLKSVGNTWKMIERRSMVNPSTGMRIDAAKVSFIIFAVLFPHCSLYIVIDRAVT